MCSSNMTTYNENGNIKSKQSIRINNNGNKDYYDKESIIIENEEKILYENGNKKLTNKKLTNNKLTNKKLTNNKLTNNKLTNNKLTNNKLSMGNIWEWFDLLFNDRMNKLEEIINNVSIDNKSINNDNLLDNDNPIINGNDNPIINDNDNPIINGNDNSIINDNDNPIINDNDNKEP